MNLLLTLAARLRRAVSKFFGQLAEAVTEGGLPEQNAHAVHANVDWGQQWVASVVGALVRGETVHLGPAELAGLAVFVASVIVARRMQATPIMVLSWRLNTTS